MTRKSWIISCSAAALAVGAGAFGAPAAAQSMQPVCTVAGIQAISPAETTIVSATLMPEPIAHCRVVGKAAAHSPESLINFTLSLPLVNWSKRFYFMGLGGSAGSMPPPPPKILGAGFAVGVTDTGRQGSSSDWSFLDDPIKLLDHTHRAGHVTTVAAQAITKKFYGADRMFRYHTGCSGGGRMGGMAAMYHPADYDGILLGDGRVSNRKMSGGTSMKFIHAVQVMNREPGAWLSPAKLKMLEAKVTEACDMTDGAKDGVVWDDRLCKFDFSKLRCKSGDGPDCLTKPEITSVNQMLEGPRDAKGQLLTTAMPITNMAQWSMFIGATPPPWSPNPAEENKARSANAYMISNTRARGMFRQDFDVLKDFNLKNPKDIAAWEAAAAKQNFEGAPDLTPLQKTGGKVILYGGVSSPCCSDVELTGYVRDLDGKIGLDQRKKFVALYNIPGQGHCGGGTGPEDHTDVMLNALMDWVEKGRQPEGIVMHSGTRTTTVYGAMKTNAEAGVNLSPATGTSRDFLVCNWPQRSVFDKSKAGVPGAVFDAVNWSCKAGS